jgi:hypothetical protein
VFGGLLEEGKSRLGQFPVARHGRLESIQGGGIRQLAVPQEAADLLERGVGREFFQRVSGNEQLAFLPVDAAERGLGRDDAF